MELPRPKELDDKLKEYQEINTEIASLNQQKNALIAQINENEMVLKELDVVAEDDSVFKLVGSVLVKQDLAEAKASVKTRSDMIKKQVSTVEARVKDFEGQLEKIKDSVVALQQEHAKKQAAALKAPEDS